MMIKVCNIKMESFAYEKYDMLYKWHDPALEFMKSVKLDQFELQGAFRLVSELLSVSAQLWSELCID